MSRTAPAAGKLIITGTGRAGTTLLVRLFTELGLDTGFDRTNWQASYDAHCHAGLEHTLTAPDAPRVIKNPSLCQELPPLLRIGAAPAIDWVIIPVRDLASAARSRIRVGGRDGEIPGGLWLTSRPEQQAGALAIAFHELIHALIEHDIPHTFLAFPRFALDPAYAYQKLGCILPDSVTLDVFQTAFARVVDPELIHSFPGASPPTNEALAAAYREKQRLAARAAQARRRQRRQRRLAAVIVTLIVTGFVWFRLSHRAS
mgnify:FL=1